MRTIPPGARPAVLAALVLAASSVVAAQSRHAPAMPSWLTTYPGAAPEVHEAGAMVVATYSTPAKVSEVVEHYRGLFQTAGLPFQPNPDGIGISIRGAAAECDLLILLREQNAGTSAEVNCAAKSQSPAKPVEVIGSKSGNGTIRRTTVTPPVTAAGALERHQQRVKELGIHPDYQDAPAPPLVWPSWLARMDGARPALRQGVDQSRKAYLETRYISHEPMSAIYSFYEDLLNANEYRVHTSKLSTGQTISGIVQNAWGFVEGTNYPDGAPGPRTVVNVGFSRSKLNEPITVTMRITAYEFVAPKSRF